MFKKNFFNILLSTLLFIVSINVLADSNAEIIEDSAITGVVKAKMLANKVVSPLDIKVETNKGVVSLQGNVKSSAEASTAIELASSTKGVIDVDASHLFIQGSTHPLADSVITAKIKGMYLREKILSDKSIAVRGIHVETSDGIVYLTGEVNTKAQAENAERLAKEVKGVKQIKSNLLIK